MGHMLKAARHDAIVELSGTGLPCEPSTSLGI